MQRKINGFRGRFGKSVALAKTNNIRVIKNLHAQILFCGKFFQKFVKVLPELFYCFFIFKNCFQLFHSPELDGQSCEILDYCFAKSDTGFYIQAAGGAIFELRRVKFPAFVAFVYENRAAGGADFFCGNLSAGVAF